VEHPPPPPPSTVEDSDILDLSMELNAASIDDVQGELDTSAIERVPNADPGFDVSRSDRPFLFLECETDVRCSGHFLR
jgi:serine/threonine-protein phosphatase 2A regulatory subunit B'